MENLEEIIKEISSKTEFTEEEKDALYFTYSKNLLLGSIEFKYVDKTLSDLFLSLSRMLVNTVAYKYDEYKDGSTDNELYLNSKFATLPENEKNTILAEIELIEKTINS